MEASLVIKVSGKSVTVDAPFHDVPTCLRMLGAGLNALALKVAEQEQQSPRIVVAQDVLVATGGDVS